MPKGDRWIEGYTTAESHMYEIQDGTREWYINPFDPNDEAHDGYEEGFYDFTQK